MKALESMQEKLALESLYFNQESAFCGRLSAGGTIETCLAVVEGKVKNAIAVVRPPGHHAEPQKAMGFCLFNNVAVAARAVMKKHPETVKRILILDWDVHHGNGTQRAFEEDPNVLYISIHRFDNGTFYPGTPYGSHTSCGSGAGLGKSVNVPWQGPGMGDADYMHAFDQIVMPIAREFNPDLVIISAGFDAAEGDELGGCLVSPTGYAHMTYMLNGLANGKLVVVLEGGYNLTSISISAVACTKILLGEPPPAYPFPTPQIRRECIDIVSDVLRYQSKYWSTLRPKHQDLFLVQNRVEPLEDIIRLHIKNAYCARYGMLELKNLGDVDPNLAKYRVLCTHNLIAANTVLFICRDAYFVPTASLASLNGQD